MTIYRLKNDGFKFQEANLRIDHLVDFFPGEMSYQDVVFFSQKQTALSEFWHPVSFEFYKSEGVHPDAEIPDICEWNVGNLILSERAKNALEDLLTQTGELLPLTANGKPYFVYNCLETVPIEKGKSVPNIVAGEVDGYRSIRFGEKTPPVFRSKEQGMSALYCDDSTKERITDHKLTGIICSGDLTGDL